MTAHWGVADPAAVGGTDDAKRKAFARAYRELSARIDLFLALPEDTVDRLTLKRKREDIGQAGSESPAR